MSSREDARCSGSAILWTHFRRIASQGRKTHPGIAGTRADWTDVLSVLSIAITEPLNLNREKSYSILRFELSQLLSEILNMVMKVRKPEYSSVIMYSQKTIAFQAETATCEFERNLLFSFRCRAAFLSMPSRYPQVEAAIEVGKA
ncbi:hypothetical protein V1508DRAFT_442924 [Lipomyces doorenjongii]|uniref:uncharacterized protein n=1 Tax=Lipomyces doorenjongii TaxID=383834 RepID=UPI0034CE123F